LWGETKGRLIWSSFGGGLLLLFSGLYYFLSVDDSFFGLFLIFIGVLFLVVGVFSAWKYGYKSSIQ